MTTGFIDFIAGPSTSRIAPFLDDVDIRRFGRVFYRETSNATLLQRARDQLQELFPSSGNFTPTTLFIATWDRVAQYGGGPQVCSYICNCLHYYKILARSKIVVLATSIELLLALPFYAHAILIKDC